VALAPLVGVTAAVVEVLAFVAVARPLGAGWAVLLIALSSVVGLVLLRREGVRAWRRFRVVAERGEPPGRQVSDGLVGLVGALLLAIPGFVSAVLGLLLLTPPVRAVVRRSVEAATARRVSSAVAGDLFGPRRVRVRRGAPVPQEPGDGPTSTAPAIEGEIVDAPASRPSAP
jgi:UPF0716 protein FxsA